MMTPKTRAAIRLQFVGSVAPVGHKLTAAVIEEYLADYRAAKTSAERLEALARIAAVSIERLNGRPIR